MVVAAGQDPAPLQLAAAVAAPPVQLAARQLVDAAGYEQVARRLPLHVPPQALPSEAQAGLPPTGAPDTATHAPTLPATLQDSHCPAQLELQHTPSTQFPEAHASATVQAVPLTPRGVQVPALQ